MIPITIADKKYKIKSIKDLTTKEFIELSKIEDLDFMKYIAWQTGVKTGDAFFAIISKSVESAIGKMPDITKMKRSKKFDYNKLIDTVGQRHQIESSGLTGYDLLVFCLAVSQARSNNIDDVNKLRDQYLQMSFTEILPSGFFFFTIYRNGRKSVLKNLLKRLELIKIRNLKKVRAYND